jgi:hypothetical protein
VYIIYKKVKKQKCGTIVLVPYKGLNTRNICTAAIEGQIIEVHNE